MTHPIRKAKIHTFKRTDLNKGGADWIAKLYPYSTYPTFFKGADEAEAIEKAQAFIDDAIRKHEADCINREAARQRAKNRKKDKA